MKKISKKTTGKAVRRTQSKVKRTARKETTKATSARGRGKFAAADTQAAGKVPTHILIVIPGFMGSKLRDPVTNEIIWLDLSAIPREPWRWDDWLDNLFAKMRYSPDTKLVPAGIMEDVVFLQPFWKDPYYSDLLALLESWGYDIDENVKSKSKLIAYTFDYDWREDFRDSADKLRKEIAEWRVKHPPAQIWLMGHSGGGIVARTLVKKTENEKLVDRLILLASPWDGSPRAVYHLMKGYDVFLRVGFDIGDIAKRTREVLRTFPAIYQIVPLQNFLHDQNGQAMDPFVDKGWLDNDPQFKLLEKGQAFNQEVGKTIAVPEAMEFFGTELLTAKTGTIQTDAAQKWLSIEWATQDSGDGTLPEYTAIFPAPVRNIPVVDEHARIFTNAELQRILKWELLGKFRNEAEPRAAVTTEQLAVQFFPTKYVYEPNEPIQVWATLEHFAIKNDTREKHPLSNARIAAELKWLQPLPGSNASPPPPPLSDTDLLPVTEIAGRYEGTLRAPQTEGYYQVEATVDTIDEKVTLQETIAVEAVPPPREQV